MRMKCIYNSGESCKTPTGIAVADLVVGSDVGQGILFLRTYRQAEFIQHVKRMNICNGR